jgi:hypothetical protein
MTFRTSLEQKTFKPMTKNDPEKAGLFPKIGLMAGVIRKTTDGVTAGVAENPEIVHVRIYTKNFRH